VWQKSLFPALWAGLPGWAKKIPTVLAVGLKEHAAAAKKRGCPVQGQPH